MTDRDGDSQADQPGGDVTKPGEALHDEELAREDDQTGYHIPLPPSGPDPGDQNAECGGQPVADPHVWTTGDAESDPTLGDLGDLHGGDEESRADMSEHRDHDHAGSSEPALECTVGHDHRGDDPQAPDGRDDEGACEQHRQGALTQVDQIGAAATDDVS